jgi:hypothetical protein
VIQWELQLPEPLRGKVDGRVVKINPKEEGIK